VERWFKPPEPQQPSLRASDSDREHVATQLRESFSEGRLTLDEFQERLQSAYAAKTQGDLAVLTRDLPVRAPPPPPPVAVGPVDRAVYWSRLRDLATRYLVICAFFLAIWFVAGRHGSFWPIWPIVVFGFFFALRALGIEQRERRRMQARARQRQRQEEKLRRRGR
jgi:hypothetical protein